MAIKYGLIVGYIFFVFQFMVNGNLASPWPIFSRESAEIVSGGKSGGCVDSVLSHLILPYCGLS